MSSDVLSFDGFVLTDGWAVLSISWKLPSKSAMGKLSRLFPHTKFEPFKVRIRINDVIIFD